MRFKPPTPALIIGVALLVLVQFGIVRPVLGKLGLTKGSALLILVVSILGSTINMPLAKLRGIRAPRRFPRGCRMNPARDILRHRPAFGQRRRLSCSDQLLHLSV